MNMFQSQYAASVYQVIDGISILLGEAPVSQTSMGCLICIPHHCISEAAGNEFRLSLPKRLLRRVRSPYLQIRHGRLVYDVFLNRNIIYLAIDCGKGGTDGDS